mgnify:CR=1 FL=1
MTEERVKTTVPRFIEDARIGFHAELLGRDIDGASGWAHDRYRCRFNRIDDGGEVRWLTTPFSMGIGHAGRAPEAHEVLSCMADDEAGVENTPQFEEWAPEYGYDPDSRKAETTYRVCVRQQVSLRAFLGHELYETLLWDCDRD